MVLISLASTYTSIVVGLLWETAIGHCRYSITWMAPRGQSSRVILRKLSHLPPRRIVCDVVEATWTMLALPSHKWQPDSVRHMRLFTGSRVWILPSSHSREQENVEASLPHSRIKVEHAKIDTHNFTEAVQQLIDDGWTAYKCWTRACPSSFSGLDTW